MNLDQFNPSNFTAAFTLDLVKNADKAEAFLKTANEVYEKLKKERAALGTLQDAKVADELATKRVKEAEQILEDARQTAGKKIQEAMAAEEAAQSRLDSREAELSALEDQLSAKERQLIKDREIFEASIFEKQRELKNLERDINKTEQELARRLNKCERILNLAKQIAHIKL